MKVNEDAEQLPARARERRLDEALKEAITLLELSAEVTVAARLAAIERLRWARRP